MKKIGKVEKKANTEVEREKNISPPPPLFD